MIRREERDDWEKVLEVMYEDPMIAENEEVDSFEDIINALENPSKLTDEVNVDPEELPEVMSDLETIGLVENSPAPLSLTQEGFQLAHQIKTERQRETTNFRLLALTAILAVLTIGLLGIEIWRLLV